MLPSSLGAAVGGVQHAIPLQKQESNEEFARPAQEQLELDIAPKNATPIVPPTNGTSLSPEAITAIQQATETTETIANNTQIASAQDLQGKIAEQIQSERDVVVVDGSQDPTVEAENAEATESRQSASTDLPVGEETDNAGRSVRNPLDLQI